MGIPELQFFGVKWGFFRISTVVFQQPFFRESSESFNSIDVHFSICESLFVVDSPMFGSIGDKAVVTTEFISVGETSPFHLFDGQVQESLTLDIGNDLLCHLPPSFQDVE